VNHVRLPWPPCPPPSLPGTAVPLKPKELWPLLTALQHQALVRLLSDLLSRRLRPPTAKEVTDEPS
jgi:hypothetical protein